MVAAVAIGLTGCGKGDETELAAMGDEAPAFGSTADLKTVPGFLKGRWCMISMATGGQPNPKRYYEFKADGTFETGNTGNEWKSTGRWVEQNGDVNLTYETMNGKPLEAFRAEYKKDEEGGGQASVAKALLYDDVFAEIGKLGTLHIDEDNKTLAFGSRPQPVQGNPMSEEGAGFQEMLNSAGGTLVRMGPKKKS